MLVIDRRAVTVTVKGRAISLTHGEYRILCCLEDYRGKVLSRPFLLEHALECAPDIATRTLDMAISRMKKKLADQSSMIESVYGRGYRLTTAQ